MDFNIQQSPQCLADGYEHMNKQNEWWKMQLKGIQVEYYSIES